MSIVDACKRFSSVHQNYVQMIRLARYQLLAVVKPHDIVNVIIATCPAAPNSLEEDLLVEK